MSGIPLNGAWACSAARISDPACEFPMGSFTSLVQQERKKRRKSVHLVASPDWAGPTAPFWDEEGKFYLGEAQRPESGAQIGNLAADTPKEWFSSIQSGALASTSVSINTCE